MGCSGDRISLVSLPLHLRFYGSFRWFSRGDKL